MCERFGMSLDEVLTRFTHRQFRTWLVWEHNRVYHPERLEYYLMKLMALIESMVSKDPGPVPISKFAITREDEQDKPASDPVVIARSQASMLRAVGYGRRKKP